MGMGELILSIVMRKFPFTIPIKLEKGSTLYSSLIAAGFNNKI